MFRLQRDLVRAALETRAQQLLAERPEVLEVRLFGSLVKGNAGPGSDADLVIVLHDSNIAFAGRIPIYLDFFVGAGISCDVFPYTKSELSRLSAEKHRFIATIWHESQVLAARANEGGSEGR